MPVRVTRGNALIGTGSLNVSAAGTISAATTISAALTVAGAVNVVAKGTAAFNPGTVANGTASTNTATNASAAVGDLVLVSSPVDLLGCGVQGYVASAGTVSIAIFNATGASRTLGTASANFVYWLVR